MKPTPEQQALSFFLPDNTFTFFDIVSSQKTDTDLHITLEEKNSPPLEARHQGMTVESKGFQDITIIDFPVRGRKTSLTFRRRRWQVGDEIIKRTINIKSPGTSLEEEFGLFLKGDS
jgi:hypothetical protein